MNQNEYDRDPRPTFWEMSYQEDNPECKHKLPGDWEFGGATEEDPRTDPRWRPVTYVYMDKMLRQRHMTQEPFCIHVAVGWYKQRLEERLGVKIFYITAAEEGGTGEMIYSDVDGAMSGQH